MPWSRWETMPHTCTVSNSFGLAFFKVYHIIFVGEILLNIPVVTEETAVQTCLPVSNCFLGFNFHLFSWLVCHYNSKTAREERRGEVQIPAVHFSTNGCVQMAWREEAFDWGTKRHLWTTKSNSRKHTDTETHTHTQLCGVLFAFARPLAPNIDGMFDWPPLAPLRHDVTPTKRHLFKEKWLFMCSGPRCETQGESRDMGQKKTLKHERKQEKARGRATRLFSELVIDRKAGLMTVVTSH